MIPLTQCTWNMLGEVSNPFSFSLRNLHVHLLQGHCSCMGINLRMESYPKMFCSKEWRENEKPLYIYIGKKELKQTRSIMLQTRNYSHGKTRIFKNEKNKRVYTRDICWRFLSYYIINKKEKNKEEKYGTNNWKKWIFFFLLQVWTQRKLPKLKIKRNHIPRYTMETTFFSSFQVLKVWTKWRLPKIERNQIPQYTVETTFFSSFQVLNPLLFL